MVSFVGLDGPPYLLCAISNPLSLCVCVCWCVRSWDGVCVIVCVCVCEKCVTALAMPDINAWRHQCLDMKQVCDGCNASHQCLTSMPHSNASHQCLTSMPHSNAKFTSLCSSIEYKPSAFTTPPPPPPHLSHSLECACMCEQLSLCA